MNRISSVVPLVPILVLICSFSGSEIGREPAEYSVRKLKRPMTIDADWDKAQWKKIKEIPISNFMGDIPAFRPVVKAKMMYDGEDRINPIFKVINYQAANLRK